jgi:hypothetical protein
VVDPNPSNLGLSMISWPSMQPVPSQFHSVISGVPSPSDV